MAPTGPASYAGFPVTPPAALAALLPGLPDRTRDAGPAARGDAAVPARRRPHRLAGHARPAGRARGRGSSASRRGGLPDRPGRLRGPLRRCSVRRPRDGAPDPQDPLPGRPDPGAVHGQPAAARGLGVPATRAVAARRRPRRVPPRAPRRGAARAELAPDGRLLVGYVGRLAPEKELELLTYSPATPLRAGGRRWRARESAAPRLLPGRRVPRCAPRRRARPRVRLARRVRAHRPARDLLPVRPGGAGLRRPGRRAARGRPDRRGGTTAWPASSTSRATATTSAATSTSSPGPRAPQPDGARRATQRRGPVLAGGQRGARRALPRGGRPAR